MSLNCFSVSLYLANNFFLSSVLLAPSLPQGERIFQCPELRGISYANIDVQLWAASYQLKSANRWA